MIFSFFLVLVNHCVSFDTQLFRTKIKTLRKSSWSFWLFFLRSELEEEAAAASSSSPEIKQRQQSTLFDFWAQSLNINRRYKPRINAMIKGVLSGGREVRRLSKSMNVRL